MIAVNIVFVPKIGYWACAWGGFAGYGIPMVISYFLGQQKYPIPYDLKAIGKFVLLAAALFAVYWFWLRTLPAWAQMTVGTVLLAPYGLLAWKEIKTSKAL